MFAEKGTPDLNSKLSSGEQDLLTGTGLVEGEGGKKPDFNIRCLSILCCLRKGMPNSVLPGALLAICCLDCTVPIFLCLGSPVQSPMYSTVLQCLAASPEV